MFTPMLTVRAQTAEANENTPTVRDTHVFLSEEEQSTNHLEIPGTVLSIDCMYSLMLLIMKKDEQLCIWFKEKLEESIVKWLKERKQEKNA